MQHAQDEPAASANTRTTSLRRAGDR